MVRNQTWKQQILTQRPRKWVPLRHWRSKTSQQSNFTFLIWRLFYRHWNLQYFSMFQSNIAYEIRCLWWISRLPTVSENRWQVKNSNKLLILEALNIIKIQPEINAKDYRAREPNSRVWFWNLFIAINSLNWFGNYSELVI